MTDECPPPDYDPPVVMAARGRPDRDVNQFALDADITVYWPWVRPCWEEAR